MKRIYYMSLTVLACLASCQKPELMMQEAEESVAQSQKMLLKSLLAERDTKWTEDELAIPQEIDGWKQITTDKELAFLLEFGSTAGEKYILVNSLDFSQSAIAGKLASEVGVEKFENFEFDGNGNTLTGLNLPWAAGLFSRVHNASIYDLTLSGCTAGAESNVSNLLGTGAVIGTASGEVAVNDVIVNGCAVSAPCKVGGFVGAVVDAACTFTGCKVIDTDVKTIYFKGVSGWCGGFAGFVGRNDETNPGIAVSVTADECSVSGGKVQAHMESESRYSGKFLGTLSGYDYNEVFTMNGCTVSTTFEGLDSKAASAVSEYHKDGNIGGHKYMNGYIYIDGISYVTPWDGSTTTKPALVDGAYVVYTAAELAWFQGRTETTNKILIRRDIDLGGHLFAPIYKASHVDGQKVDGKNAEILNLKIVRENCGKEDGGAFIRQASGTTVHKNITFRNADIKATHDVSADHGNAYCATLCSNMTGTYSMENVHAYDGKLYGVNKMGGLLGRVFTTAATISNCSVTGYDIQNYEVPDKPETFSKTVFGMSISETFYPQGEVGGMIGFIQGSAHVSNCHVYATKINASGQKDVTKYIVAVIPGRHVGTVIGDIRTSSTSHEIRLDNVSSDQATVSLANQTWLTQQKNAVFVGKCYCVPLDDKGKIYVDGTSLSF